jgi:hypothetical protein
MAFTTNSAKAMRNSDVDAVKLLSIKINAGIEFDEDVFELLRDALSYDFALGMRVVMHFGNSRGEAGKQRKLRSNMDAVLPENLQTGSYTDSEAEDVRGGMMIRVEWMKCLEYIYDHFPEMFVDETNLALFARNGCLKDLLEICVYAVYGNDMDSRGGKTPKSMMSRDDRKIENGLRFLNDHPTIFPTGTHPMDTIFEFRFFERNVSEPGGFKITSMDKIVSRMAKDERDFKEAQHGSLKGWCYENKRFCEWRKRLETMRDDAENTRHVKTYQVWCREQEIEKKKTAKVVANVLAMKRYDSVCNAMQGFNVRELRWDSKVSETNKVARLFQGVGRIFSTLIGEDLLLIAKGKKKSVSGLAAKWAPSPNGRHSKLTLLDVVIGNYLCDKYFQIMDHHGSYSKTLKLVRQAAGVPECFMEDLTKLQFHRVASLAMLKYNKLFENNAVVAPMYNVFRQERQLAYDAAMAEFEAADSEESKIAALGRAQKAGIAAASVHPHEIVGSFLGNKKGRSLTASDEILSSMWATQLTGVMKAAISNRFWDIIMCDVSASMETMNCLPMNNSIGLGIMAALAAPGNSPFHGHLITFAEEPSMFDLRGMVGGPVREMVEAVRDMSWGGSTDFVKAFEIVLEMAVAGKLSLSELNQVRMVVMSDMQFNCSCNDWETSYETIVRLGEEAGYKGFQPNIVFWNLAVDLQKSIPVSNETRGVVQLAGYSVSNLMAVMNLKMEGFNEATIYNNRAYEGLKIPLVCVRRANFVSRLAWAQLLLRQCRQQRARPSVIKKCTRRVQRVLLFS